MADATRASAAPPRRPSRRAGWRWPRLPRSAALRLAAAFALLFAASSLLLLSFLWWATAGLLDREVESAIRTDARDLAARWNEAALPGLLDGIRDRLAHDLDGDAIYLLADAGGRRVAGNLDAWPAGVDQPELWYELPIVQLGRSGAAALPANAAASPVRGLARVRRFDLPAGLRLLVGRNVQLRAALREVLTRTLGWALVLAVLLGTAGALAAQRLFRRMLASVAETAAALHAGDLARRVRLTGRDDEFDRLAETVNGMLDRMARLMDGVRQVSNSIAHDLRTPIARARARLEDAAEHAPDLPALRAAAERAVTELDGVVTVFQALLRIAEIEAGSARSAFAPFDAAPLLADLAELYGAAAEERGLVLVLDAPGPLPAVGDRALVQQAVANLLDNAVKFSPPGGTVQVDGRALPGHLQLRVSDTGPGIPAADRPRATERFFRGESARHTPGFGLGLALAQAVAQLHGGTLRLEDAGPGPRPGLRVVLDLPRDAA